MAKRKLKFNNYLFLLLLAFEVLLSFTFLGYIHMPPISVTLAYIPIIIAAYLLGTAESAAVGLVCGLASMYKASASYVMPSDKIFSPIMSGESFNSIMLSVGTRVFFGVVIGILFSVAKKQKHSAFWVGILALISSKIYSFIVYASFGILFPESGYSYLNNHVIDLKNIILAIFCLVLILSFRQLFKTKKVQRIKEYIDQSANNPYLASNFNIGFTIFSLSIIAMTIMAAVYFSNRSAFMLSAHGVEISSVIDDDLLHLQMQFTMAAISLNIISSIVLIMIYKYMAYREYLVELDDLTGVMGRKMFMFYLEKILAKSTVSSPKKGWLLMIDVDYFKSINDTFGHPVGDRVLTDFSSHLKHAFSDIGTIGRIGGDEFSLVIEDAVSENELKRRLDAFYKDISNIPEKVSCSAGICLFSYPAERSSLMEKTDFILYKAKKRGRGCYILDD